MSLWDWYRYHISDGDWQDMIYHLYLGMWRRIGRVVNYGTPIWEEPWDVMLVLDACRYDSMIKVADEYDFMEGVDSRYSVGSESGDWMKENFDAETYGEELAETVYVTGNTKTVNYADLSHFRHADEVWRYAWNDEWGTIEADAITDRAIDASRSLDPERLLVHYLQPHLPLVPPMRTGMNVSKNLFAADWEAIRRDPTITESMLREATLANLRYVLDSVGRLLKNIDADTVIITADHGNLFGEWRGAGLYGHPPNTPVPLLKRVPWVVTEAENTAGEEPTLKPTAEIGDVEEKLAALGYK